MTDSFAADTAFNKKQQLMMVKYDGEMNSIQWFVSETTFQASLSAFLRSLEINVEMLLQGVDFSQLSPAVNLIYTIPGLYCSVLGEALAVNKLWK